MHITLCGRETRPLVRFELFFTDRYPLVLYIREEQEPLAQIEQRLELMERHGAWGYCVGHQH